MFIDVQPFNLLLALKLAVLAASSASAQVTPASHGINVVWGAPKCVSCSCLLAVEGTGSFLLSWAFGGETQQITTPMVSQKRDDQYAAHTTLQNATHAGICTDFGCIVMDMESGGFALLDAENNTATTGTAAAIGFAEASIGVTLRKASPSTRFYASGGDSGGSGSLAHQTQVVPSVGNRVWWLPRYWSSDGYSALGVGSGAVAGASDGGQWRANASAVTWKLPAAAAAAAAASATASAAASAPASTAGPLLPSAPLASSVLRADLYLSPSASPASSLSHLYDLSGRVALPPK
jgi:hypothetical protein